MPRAPPELVAPDSEFRGKQGPSGQEEQRKKVLIPLQDVLEGVAAAREKGGAARRTVPTEPAREVGAAGPARAPGASPRPRSNAPCQPGKARAPRPSLPLEAPVRSRGLREAENPN